MDQEQLNLYRHSLAHVMAAAILQLWPQAKFGVGPVIDNGFYYDVEVDNEKITEKDLEKISHQMKKIISSNASFSRQEVSIDTAIEKFNQLGQKYKVELLMALKEKGTTKMNNDESEVLPTRASQVSIYQTGEFIDLCRGPHINSTKELENCAWQLHTVAGAYWRGNENNPMLTRVYGLAFASRQELDNYLQLLEMAKARDHKKIGPELDLFTFSDLVGSGLPLWTPRGMAMRALLDNFVWQMRLERGYEQVEIPHITKSDLYEVSGHWDKFKDELFKIITREGHEFAMKPMNCPHHTQIFNRKKWSYRELPQRYSNTTMVYRDEQSGELSGLARVRSITQDDAHVFCRSSQINEEASKIWDIIEKFYLAVGFNLSIRLSLHDPEQAEKYLGSNQLWLESEECLRQIVISRKGKDFIEAKGEAAFYGPKIDFMAKDSLQREWQVATIQLDMNLPERFELNCINEEGKNEQVIMIHCAIMGSIERYLAILIEHFAGNFPLWLCPEQIRVISVAEAHSDYCKKLAEKMTIAGLQVGLDLTNESVAKKIRQAVNYKIPYLLVVGDKEMNSDKLAVKVRGQEDLWTISQAEFIDSCLNKIKNKSLDL